MMQMMLIFFVEFSDESESVHELVNDNLCSDDDEPELYKDGVTEMVTAPAAPNVSLRQQFWTYRSDGELKQKQKRNQWQAPVLQRQISVCQSVCSREAGPHRHGFVLSEVRWRHIKPSRPWSLVLQLASCLMWSHTVFGSRAYIAAGQRTSCWYGCRRHWSRSGARTDGTSCRCSGWSLCRVWHADPLVYLSHCKVVQWVDCDSGYYWYHKCCSGMKDRQPKIFVCLNCSNDLLQWYYN